MDNTQKWMDLESAVIELLEDGEDDDDIKEAVDGHIDSYRNPVSTGPRRPKPNRS